MNVLCDDILVNILWFSVNLGISCDLFIDFIEKQTIKLLNSKIYFLHKNPSRFNVIRNGRFNTKNHHSKEIGKQPLKNQSPQWHEFAVLVANVKILLNYAKNLWICKDQFLAGPKFAKIVACPGQNRNKSFHLKTGFSRTQTKQIFVYNLTV